MRLPEIARVQTRGSRAAVENASIALVASRLADDDTEAALLHSQGTKDIPGLSSSAVLLAVDRAKEYQPELDLVSIGAFVQFVKPTAIDPYYELLRLYRHGLEVSSLLAGNGADPQDRQRLSMADIELLVAMLDHAIDAAEGQLSTLNFVKESKKREGIYRLTEVAKEVSASLRSSLQSDR